MDWARLTRCSSSGSIWPGLKNTGGLLVCSVHGRRTVFGCKQAHLTRSAVPQLDVSRETVRVWESRQALLAAVARLDFTAMRPLMVDHVTQLGRLDVAVQALEKLVRSSSRLVDHVLLDEAHVARVVPVPVADALLDHLFRDGLHLLECLFYFGAAFELVLRRAALIFIRAHLNQILGYCVAERLVRLLLGHI